MVTAIYGKQWRRYRQVLRVFGRSGWKYLRADDQRRGQYIRLALEELGPTFVKMGQLASTRPDLLPKVVTDELELLQDRVPPVPSDQIRAALERAFGESYNHIFRSFEWSPMASASIGQVHRATLVDGTEVAVKIKRPGIEEQIEVDLAIVQRLARLVERRFPSLSHYRLGDLAEEFAHTLRQELDYVQEARNAESFYNLFLDDERVIIPKVFTGLTNKDVLTLEYVNGVKLHQAAGMQRPAEARQISAVLTEVMLRQILDWGIFHADLHPGNVLLSPDGRITFLDFGMIGRLNGKRRRQLVQMIVALIANDAPRIVKLLLNMGVVDGSVDRALLHRDVERMRDRYIDASIKDIKLGNAIQDMLILAGRHKVYLPRDFALLARATMTLEGLVHQLDPDFRVIEVTEPLVRKLLLRRIKPEAGPFEWLRSSYGLIERLSGLPAKLSLILDNLGERAWQFSLPEHDFRKLSFLLNRLVNRLVLATLFLGICLLGAGMAVALALQGSFFAGPELMRILLAAAGVLFLFLLITLWRSGRNP